jgi:hypothetical protein
MTATDRAMCTEESDRIRELETRLAEIAHYLAAALDSYVPAVSGATLLTRGELADIEAALATARGQA